MDDDRLESFGIDREELVRRAREADAHAQHCDPWTNLVAEEIFGPTPAGSRLRLTLCPHGHTVMGYLEVVDDDPDTPQLWVAAVNQACAWERPD